MPTVSRIVQWWSGPYPAPGLIDLATLAMVVGFEHDQDPRDAWQLHGDAAIRMELALTECQVSAGLLHALRALVRGRRPGPAAFEG